MCIVRSAFVHTTGFLITCFVAGVLTDVGASFLVLPFKVGNFFGCVCVPGVAFIASFGGVAAGFCTFLLTGGADSLVVEATPFEIFGGAFFVA